VNRTAIAAALLATATALTACSSSDSSDDKPAAKAPAYEITHQDDSGNQRRVTVEVKSTEGLRAVFDDVAGKLKDDAGWFVEINCATGGIGKADNRLANGKKAVGKIGAASTGLDDGKTEYEAQPNPKCPA
jgi:major membrane immunogen (membrane-anchored lipoprotein)